ncbi:hypothetical protein BJX76DRAFT_356944 [Aspergillus varians]
MTKTEAFGNREPSPGWYARPSGHRIDTMLSELRQAVMLSQSEKVLELLVDHKCPIDREIIRYAAVTYFNKSVFEIIATFLAERRQHLLKLARTHLSPSQLIKLGIRCEQRLLDSQAATTAAELLTCNFIDYSAVRYFVPDFTWTSSATSVYFLVGCNSDAAQILYNVGFRNVDEVDQLVYSPLAGLEVPSMNGYHGQYQIKEPTEALSRYLAMCAWFHNRGSLLTRVFGLAQATPLHHIAGRIGKSFAYLLEAHCKIQEGEDTKTFNRRFVDGWIDVLRPLISGSTILQEIFKDIEHHDLFSCACSLGGSLPSNVLINETIYGYSPANRLRLPLVVSPLVALLVETQEPNQNQNSSPVLDLRERLASIVIRAYSFACLDLPHTCRSASLERFRLMHDEGQATNNGLDKVVSEAEMKFRASGLPLSQFLLVNAQCMEKYQIEPLMKNP